MKVKVNLNKIPELNQEIVLTSEQVKGVSTYQGMPLYQPTEVTGAIYFDKEEFTNLCLETTKKAYNELIFDVELVFCAKIDVTCNNEVEFTVDVVGEPKVLDEEIIYFDKFEVV